VDAALYWTIWIALLLFCAGEIGQRDLDAGRIPALWTWWAFSAGALLCVVHVTIAMATRYGWSHEAALVATARQTSAVYGLNWGGGLYVNYVFVAVWLHEVWRWRRGPSGAGRAPFAAWTTRAFFFVIILNGAVIFAGGARRLVGGLIVLWLLWIWRPPTRKPLRLRAGQRS
jgi:hypothetical protein